MKNKCFILLFATVLLSCIYSCTKEEDIAATISVSMADTIVVRKKLEGLPGVATVSFRVDATGGQSPYARLSLTGTPEGTSINFSSDKGYLPFSGNMILQIDNVTPSGSYNLQMMVDTGSGAESYKSLVLAIKEAPRCIEAVNRAFEGFFVSDTAKHQLFTPVLIDDTTARIDNFYNSGSQLFINLFCASKKIIVHEQEVALKGERCKVSGDGSYTPDPETGMVAQAFLTLKIVNLDRNTTEYRQYYIMPYFVPMPT